MRTWDVVLYATLWGCCLFVTYIILLGALSPDHRVIALTNDYNEMWVELPVFVALSALGAWRLWRFAGKP